jgi:hypothetical protein
MTWDTLANIETTKSWQYTPLVLGRLFRLRHTTNSSHPQDLRAVIGQSFQDDIQMFFDTSRVSFKPEIEIFIFIQPSEFLERSIGVKRLDSLSDSWTIEIEALDPIFIVGSPNLLAKFNKIKSSVMAGIL